ncbi:MAG TPA: laccase domain-containing protein, partial [Gemmatimonadales bacterium]|nr:laccase domain-containing protein [Gemmatimonadales bacterium]
MTTDEVRLPGRLPLWEIPGWRERFGVVAGITGRSTSDGEAFDLGLTTRSAVADVMQRWRDFRNAMHQFDKQAMALQVHGNRVVWHDAAPGWTIIDGADGHATATPDLLLMVTVADCVPVYLVARDKGAVALLHAGWRGTAAGILERGLAILAAHAGAAPDEVVMHTGVAISGPCYQVGGEVMEQLGRAHPGAGPWQLDLRDLLAEQGRALGVAEITSSGH